jgi:hypothetical protein
MLLVPFPRLAGQTRDQARGHLAHRAFHFPLIAGRQHWSDVRGELPHRDLSREVALEQRTANPALFLLHVTEKCFDDPRRIDARIFQRDRQVEQVTALPPLIERPQLRPQQLIKVIGGNVGRARYQRDDTVKGTEARSNSAKCSRELISTLRRSRSGGVSSEPKR